MIKNKKLLLVSSLALVSMLSMAVGCSNGNKTSSVSEAPSVVSSENAVVSSSAPNAPKVSVGSVKEAINKLANSKNYTIEVTTKTGPLDIVNHMYYTENAFYDDYLGDEVGYCKVDDGVFKFDRYARKYTPSMILKNAKGEKYDSIWGNGFFYGFNDLDLSEFDSADGKTFTCSKKKNKLSFMKMFSIDQKKYTELKSIEITVGDDIDSFTFGVELSSGEKHTCKIQNFENTKVEYLEKQFAKGNTYYQADETLSKVNDLFKGLNYTHLNYDYDFDKVNPVGYEKYTEDYFISGYTSEYIKYNSSVVVTSSGMIGFNDYKVNEKYTMNGSYWAYVSGDMYSITTSFYYNEDPYVPNVYTYPSFLMALSQPQYFESAGVEGKYYTSKLSVVKDFCDNFQLWDGLNDNSFTPCGLFVTYDKSYQGKDTVTFGIEYDYYGVKGTTDFIFSDFGITEEKVMEHQYAEKYVQCYYNGTKAYATVGESALKRISIHQSKTWLLDDNIVEQYTAAYKDTKANDIVNIQTTLDGETLVGLSVSLDPSEDNVLVINSENRVVCTKDGYLVLTLTKYKDGSLKLLGTI